MYDSSNIFARIIRAEIPCTFIAQTLHSLAFKDINPLVPIHVLIIPKGFYKNIHDFYNHASSEEIMDFSHLIGQLPTILGVQDGYRLVTNTGKDGAQEIPHFHMHFLAGKALGKIL